MQLAKQIGLLTGTPHLELRVQESVHWDFTLYQGGEVIADFSTRVNYFNPDPELSPPWKKGDAATFEKYSNVPTKTVSPYLIDWDSVNSPGYAVAGDRYRLGNWCQIVDFMRCAIGVADPLDHPSRFEFDVPSWTTAYVRQPLWRRVVRRISVCVKGTYPDVPRRTAEQRKELERLPASSRIVKVDLTEPDADE